ncbi:MAG: ABC transporter permease [Cyclobacteriaceae bacterium]|nr:ABC transporter permease [Cyclobacteriaceae bacterium]
MKETLTPPQHLLRFLRWFCREDYIEEIEGDLTEVFRKESESSPKWAKWKFTWSVIKYFRPEFMKSFKNYQPNAIGMYKSYFKIGWRSLLKNKGYSYINVAGLTVGMAVTLLIGLWVLDEVSFNRYHKNYDRIAQVYQHQTVFNERKTNPAVPVPLANELKNVYRSDFKHVVPTWWIGSHVLSVGDKKIPRNGVFMAKEGLEMFSFEMLQGSWKSLDDPSSVILSESTAQILFGDRDPVNQILKVDNLMDVKVTGVFKEIPFNSKFHSLQFISGWDLWVSANPWLKDDENNWNSDDINFTDIIIYVEIEPTTTFESVSKKIEKIKFNKLPHEQAIRENPQVFLQPMSRWHLHSQWENGQGAGGRIQFVWLFGIIGIFVLILACINFMNLSTAQSEMRAKEVGVRKTVGSARIQLIGQFFVETFLVVLAAFIFSIVLAAIALPGFNQLAEKEMTMPWTNPTFIAGALGFILFNTMLAGSYPALFLSSFQPVKVLKGTFRLGKLVHAPRKVLVVVQFSVSVTLIIGTITVWKQIQYAKNRPVGYTREGLIMVRKNSPDFFGKIQPLRNKLKQANAIVELAQSSSPVTETWFTFNNFNWQGKNPDAKIAFTCSAVTYDYGTTMGWNFAQGRDYSRDFSTDSSAVILNQTAARLIGWKNPIDEEVIWSGMKFTVIGVVQDMVVDSPYEPVRPAVYFIRNNFIQNTLGAAWINIRLNPQLSTHEAIERVESVFKSVIPAVPFEFKFVDQEYERKFASEERVGKLASLFALLAIFISCLGLFGLTLYVAEQRTKEIAIRKIMGASITSLWKMLSKDFVALVILSFAIAVPVSYYFMFGWLQSYEYRTGMPWYLFAIVGIGTLVITLLTVSVQTIKAALTNPVDSLRSE